MHGGAQILGLAQEMQGTMRDAPAACNHAVIAKVVPSSAEHALKPCGKSVLDAQRADTL